MIQGDGIDIKMIELVLQAMRQSGWSADNIAFGSGGGLLQKLNRDTQKFAFKCSWAEIDGQGVEVFKQPITDNGKRSKAGRFKLVNGDAEPNCSGTVEFLTVPPSDPREDRMRFVFRNGELLVDETFAQFGSAARLGRSAELREGRASVW